LIAGIVNYNLAEGI